MINDGKRILTGRWIDGFTEQDLSVDPDRMLFGKWIQEGLYVRGTLLVFGGGGGEVSGREK
jgi:hypothetical protein